MPHLKRYTMVKQLHKKVFIKTKNNVGEVCGEREDKNEEMENLRL